MIGSKHLVEGRPVLEQTGGRLLRARHEVGVDAPLAQRGRGDAADRRDLEPGEGTGVEPELLEALPHGAHGVDRREADPLVASGDETLDGLLHLLRGARRLDGDGRHDVGGRAVAREPVDHRARLRLRARHEHLPAEERLGLEPGELVPQVDVGRHDGHRDIERLLAAEDSVDRAERRGDRRLSHCRGALAQRHRRLRGPPCCQQAGEARADRGRRSHEHDRVVRRGVCRVVEAAVDAEDVERSRRLGRERHTGIRRAGGDGGDPGDDIEAAARPCGRRGPPRRGR